MYTHFSRSVVEDELLDQKYKSSMKDEQIIVIIIIK